MMELAISDVANALLVAGAQFVSAVEDPVRREEIARRYVQSITEVMNEVCGVEDGWTPETIVAVHLETFLGHMQEVRDRRAELVGGEDTNWPTLLSEVEP